MQRCDVTVRLAGDLGNTVRKTGVSPAEIVILRHVHGGPDTVIDIQPTSMDKVPHDKERQRLVYIYGQPVVDQIFPGAFAKLPVSLREVAVDMDDVADLGEDGQPVTEGETAVDPSDPILSNEVTLEDRELIDKVLTAKTKAELRDMAIEHEVNLNGVADRMDEIQKAIITGLFPNYQL